MVVFILFNNTENENSVVSLISNIFWAVTFILVFAYVISHKKENIHLNVGSAEKNLTLKNETKFVKEK